MGLLGQLGLLGQRAGLGLCGLGPRLGGLRGSLLWMGALIDGGLGLGLQKWLGL